ncbi:MAG TPA: Holliday junction branch migration protein RuvA [Pirellulaceae bacterium]|nr:Holliday junction branch migration protein RuvA [Pirellulaceae bacterium]
MITKLTGKLLSVEEDSVTVSVEPFEYEVLIPDFNRRQLQSQLGKSVSFHTIHYLEGNPAHGRMTPRLIGFLRKVEREFFEMFCSVDGVGVKKALRAMVKPVQDVATLIEEQDAKGLSTLPGIGAATSERIIAKLRRKMPKFALLVGRDEPGAVVDDQRDVVEDTFQALCALGHSESDAKKLLDAALASKKRFKDVNALLTAIYEQSHGRD